jgi:aconitate hydratase
MLASRQVLGSVARSRTLAAGSLGVRRMATVSDSPLDRKVSKLFCAARQSFQ